MVSRDAPTPEEQEIVESVPFKQGDYDFSAYGGDRFFKNRQIKYSFYYFGDGSYDDRKAVEQDLKRMLLPQTISDLYDTHDKIYHWRGKVKSITVDDDAEFGNLKAEIAFNCYPFAIRNNDEFSDIWDEVYFPHWIFLKKRFTVDGKSTYTLTNIGSHVAEVTIKQVSGNVSYSGQSLSEKGVSILFAAKRGKNKIEFDGKGIVEFSFVREEMI